MKRYILLALTLLTVVGLCACAAKTPAVLSDKTVDSKKVAMSIAGDKSRTDQITVSMKNQTKEELIWGEMFYLEQERDGKWYVVNSKDDAFWIEIAYGLEPEQTSENVCYVTEMYGKLSAGHYRILKEFYAGEKFFAAVEFEVK